MEGQGQLAAAGKEWMDCNPLGANKGTAIEFVQKHFGISPEETCTFGDNLNDIEMLQMPAGATRSPTPERGSHRRGKRYLCALLGEWSPPALKNIFITKRIVSIQRQCPGVHGSFLLSL